MDETYKSTAEIESKTPKPINLDAIKALCATNDSRAGNIAAWWNMRKQVGELIDELGAARNVCGAARAYVDYEHGDGNLVDLEMGLNIALDEWEERSGNGG